MASSREIALETLLKIDTHDAYSNLALQNILRKHSLSAQDRHFVTQLVYGTVQFQLLLDHYLQPFLKQPVEKLKPWVRQLLRMSTYQLFFLERVPPFAIVNEAVSIGALRGGSLRGFINAVLRNLQRSEAYKQRASQLDVTQQTSASDIAIKTSHPSWMIQDWIDEFGLERAKSIAVSNNQRPFVSLRVNVRKITRDALYAQLKGEGLSVELSPVSPVGIRLLEGVDAAQWKWFREGFVTMQDESAMLVAPVLDPVKGMRLLDACAAPGGKTTHLAELLDDDADIVAADLHRHKMELITGAAKRLHLSSIRPEVRDMSLSGAEIAPFDRILLDAPCSGLGVIRRKPDLKWRKTPEDVTELPNLQQRLLHECWRHLRPGGVLVYSTCTIRSSENSRVIESFCQRQEDALLDDVRDLLPEQVAEQVLVSPFGVTILPDQFGSDGFFIARLSKM
ncbi:MAG: rRNA methyltransferase [Bacilli bacterium]|nr:rRNA methyltransferase [Bacilli bacterium]